MAAQTPRGDSDQASSPVDRRAADILAANCSAVRYLRRVPQRCSKADVGVKPPLPPTGGVLGPAASAPEELQDEWRLLYRRHSRMAMERLRLDADIVAGIA